MINGAIRRFSARLSNKYPAGSISCFFSRIPGNRLICKPLLFILHFPIISSVVKRAYADTENFKIKNIDIFPENEYCMNHLIQLYGGLLSWSR